MMENIDLGIGKLKLSTHGRGVDFNKDRSYRGQPLTLIMKDRNGAKKGKRWINSESRISRDLAEYGSVI